MKRVLIAVAAGAFLIGAAAAQQPTASPGTSSTQQTQTPAASPAAQAPEPSTSQPQTQMPQTQAPQTQSSSTSTASATSGQPNHVSKIAPGSVIPVQLTKKVDAKKAKVGDPVEAKVTQDMNTSNGQLVIPKDAKVVGHVTEAQQRSKGQKESELGIAFDHAVTKTGDTQLPMSIQAIIVPPSENLAATPGSEPGAGTSPGASGMPGGARPGMGSTGATNRNAGASTGMPAPSTQSQPGANGQSAGSALPPITWNTQGVIGNPDLKLAPPQSGAQGSVVTSDKKNVKLDSGTLLLLKVQQ